MGGQGWKAMNIKEAKTEIIHTLRSYFTRDAYGDYLIPPIRQRPVLLMGPPGIGKTQIMEQIASETGVALVSYTITHHTRQSAVGLPFIETRHYGGVERRVTEYTMSEILASVYAVMERTGLKEGILFLDEINCVSETLAPMMLQFLQCKTFGNQALPEGWLIVAAGNPPEYNRSVREFDVVTLDRVRRMDVTEDFGVWKEYALRKGLHSAVISYLDIKKEHFYRVEQDADGLHFATARGWEDLSELLRAYEALGLQAGRGVIGEYIQFPRIAKDFANYLSLYEKYRQSYRIDEILSGESAAVTASAFRTAPFDEKLSVLGLLISRLSESARLTRYADAVLTAVHAALKEFRDRLSGKPPRLLLAELLSGRQEQMRRSRDAGQLDTETRTLLRREQSAMEGLLARLTEATSQEEAMDMAREVIASLAEERRTLGAQAGAMFDHAFDFLERTAGEGQELALFVTELTAAYDTSWFVEHFGCEAYFRHNRALFFDETHERLAREIITALP